VNRTLSSIGGTVAAMHAVCTSPSSKQSQFTLFAGHIAGGTHHAFYDRYSIARISLIQFTHSFQRAGCVLCVEALAFKCYVHVLTERE
jgi:hypothetical protein